MGLESKKATRTKRQRETLEEKKIHGGVYRLQQQSTIRNAQQKTKRLSLSLSFYESMSGVLVEKESKDEKETRVTPF